MGTRPSKTSKRARLRFEHWSRVVTGHGPSAATHQPRPEDIGDIEALADSIATVRLLQSIVMMRHFASVQSGEVPVPTLSQCFLEARQGDEVEADAVRETGVVEQ